MAGDDTISWPTCSKAECIGIRLDMGGKCLAHATEQDRDAALKQLGDEGTIDARGVTISAELLHRILGAAPRAKRRDQPRFTKASFNRATFGDDANFKGAKFGDEASFEGATFRGPGQF
jgi:uncharacterized protein YjbI with pentapeptide repeats